LPLPKAVTAHGWLLFDNSKMSKSKGNIVRTETILDAFGTLCPPKPLADGNDQVPQGFSLGSQPDQKEKGALAPGFAEPTPHDRDLFASDILRYFLLREIPFGQDGSFSFDALITRYNADLANGYGNLVSRVLTMVRKFFPNEIIPSLDQVHDFHSIASRAFMVGMIGFNPETIEKIERLVSGFGLENGFVEALNTINSLIKWTDEVLTLFKPWKERETPEVTEYVRAQCMYQATESIRLITAMLYPIMPYATARVWAQLGLGDIELAAQNGELKNLQWGGLNPGTKLGPLSPIFPRADKSLIETMINMENENVKPSEPLALDPRPSALATEPTDTTHPAAGPRPVHEPTGTLPVGGSTALTTGPDPVPPSEPLALDPRPSALATIDDFAKIELRVAQIVVAERIPKADKLLRIEVDLGPDFPRRQILSGIAEHYTPEELIGRRIVVITNLAPRKMRGLESHGMLLAASNGENGKPILATFAEDIALGSRLK